MASRPAGALRAAFFVSIAPPATGPLFFFLPPRTCVVGRPRGRPAASVLPPGVGSASRAASCEVQVTGAGPCGPRGTWRAPNMAARAGGEGFPALHCEHKAKAGRAGAAAAGRPPFSAGHAHAHPGAGRGFAGRPAHPRGFPAPRPFVWALGFVSFSLCFSPSPPSPSLCAPGRVPTDTCVRVRACAGSCAGGPGRGRAAGPAPLFGDPTTRSSAA